MAEFLVRVQVNAIVSLLLSLFFCFALLFGSLVICLLLFYLFLVVNKVGI